MAVILRIAPRNLLIIVAMILFVPVRGFAQDPAVSPDWTLETVSGETVNLDSLVTEQPTVLFFWATWCPYCKALMPHLQSIELEYGDDVRIIALTIRDDDGDPVGYVHDNGFDFTLIANADEIAAQNGVYGTPGVLILDPDRNVIFNLYKLPQQVTPAHIDSAGNQRKSAFRGPYWAAEIRGALDDLIESSYSD